MFLFSSADFFKIKFLQLYHPGPPSESNSLDPDQDRHSVGLYLGSNCLQKAIGRRQNSPLACKEL